MASAMVGSGVLTGDRKTGVSGMSDQRKLATEDCRDWSGGPQKGISLILPLALYSKMPLFLHLPMEDWVVVPPFALRSSGIIR